MAKPYRPAKGAGMTQGEAGAYCASQGMRLPTETEAKGISGPSFDRCSFPCDWATWTSTPYGTKGGQQQVVVRFSSGDTTNFGSVVPTWELASESLEPRSVLCVRTGM
jgi:hypothetical protein